jgi:hypothetical protein
MVGPLNITKLSTDIPVVLHGRLHTNFSGVNAAHTGKLGTD